MLLRKRPRPGLCRLQCCLLVLTLGCALAMVAMLRPAPRHLRQAGTAQASRHHPEAGYRLDFGEPQEWVLEAEDEDTEYGTLEGLPSLLALQEDQLLVAVVSPRARGNQSQGRRAGSYQLVKQLGRRKDEGAPESDWGAEEEELTRLGLDPLGLHGELSARSPLQRALPEVRHPLCLQQQPGDGLPTASVILSFHGEDWPALLRTVHSILRTAPRAFLKEIILVDDLSEQGQLKSALSEHVARLEGVKLLRSNKRLGAVKARMLGATRAAGDVLVFMDAHCECHPGWLEPLLGRIAGDRSRVVSPVIDVIDWKTLQYYPSRDLQRGVLDWKLDFHWEPLPERERKAFQSPISPIRSPVVPGQVVAVDRHYFQNTGAYDPLLSQQGGENLELSFKAWLCGGSVEILPCSRVGHVYRSQDADSSLEREAILQDKARIAETWLGSFKETFYRHSPEASSVSTLHNTGLGLCADCQAEGDIQACPVVLAPCSDSRQQQHLEHTGRKEIHFGSPRHLCFDVRREQVILQNCTGEGPAIRQQHWDVQENGMIAHILSGKCMEAMTQENSGVVLAPCDGRASQLWRFDHARAVDER
ncbi:Polypeptide N-acetylgalactosaminyltransferase-like protein 2 [Tupaia chinensis]|uniref:Polypeptide N-acetylgalactosaminyltransferase n=1 Tax=Tupaia chinensis TaxID=246437 RepID=L8Y0Q8_TUPCH|nr:Polypeptide N-acetylgalactosaminyltransferase-like protein 2 [Tupaia chinensis]